jgi:hypothetical protein
MYMCVQMYVVYMSIYVYLLPCVVEVFSFLVTVTTANRQERKTMLCNMHVLTLTCCIYHPIA